MVNEVALVMLVGMFGWEIALLYMFSGITLAVISGMIIGRLHLESYVEDFVYQIKVKQSVQHLDLPLTWPDRFAQALCILHALGGKRRRDFAGIRRPGERLRQRDQAANVLGDTRGIDHRFQERVGRQTVRTMRAGVVTRVGRCPPS